MQQHAITIRAIEPDDLAGINDVVSQPRAVWGTLEVPLQSIEARRKWLDAAPAGAVRLVAVLNGQVIGFGALYPEENRRRSHAARIDMAIHDAYVGRGAGRELMMALVDHADRWLNLSRLEAVVWTDNGQAIEMYEGFGFEREGVMRRFAFRDGGFADALAMARLRPLSNKIDALIDAAQKPAVKLLRRALVEPATD